MKIKTLLITCALVVAAGAGTSYIVRRSYNNSAKIVEVTPVTYVNSASYGMGDESTVSGTIISKDTQVVTLDTSHELTDVYVQAGDKVKKGDKLLEYDMLADELKAEKEELTKMGLELSLESLKKDLATLQSGRMPGEESGDYDAAYLSNDNDDDDDDDDEAVEAEDDDEVGAADTMAEDSVRTGASQRTSSHSNFVQLRRMFSPLTGLSQTSQADEIVSDEDESETESETEVYLKDGNYLLTGTSAIPDAIPADGEDAAALFSSTVDEDISSDISDGIPADGDSSTVFEEEGSGLNQPDAIPSDTALIPDSDTPALTGSETTASDAVDSGDVTASESTDIIEDDAIEADSGYETVDTDAVSTLETNFDGEGIVDDSTEDVSVTIIPAVNSFLQSVNAITNAVNAGWGAIAGQMSAIDSAMEEFQVTFATAYEFQAVDLFGDTVTMYAYQVSDNIVADVGSATASVMQTAYDRLCAYHFINTMLTLNPNSYSSSSIDTAWAAERETLIRAAVKELAGLPDSLWVYNSSTGQYEFSDMYSAMNKKIFSGESMVEFLAGAVYLLSDHSVLEESTDVTPEVSLDGKSLQELKGLSENSDKDSGIGYTAEELAEAIKEQERTIKETELQIREAELGLKEYQKILDGRIVYATMDGIVKSAGSLEESSGNAFITITGKAGLYVQGTVNELDLDTVKVGDIIRGTSYSTGGSFTAEIVEISEYPSNQSDSYMYGEGNTNSSYYPFLAYIENADGLEVDSYVDLSMSGEGTNIEAEDGSGSGLALDEYFIRKDSNGRNYCFVRGKDGLLEKRYLEVGANNWGVINIKSGLTYNDMIAFPYGDGVEEGAKTVEVESLTAVDGEDY